MPAVQPCGIPLVQRGQAMPAGLTDRMRRALNASFTLRPPGARFVVCTRGSPGRQNVPSRKRGSPASLAARAFAPQWATCPPCAELLRLRLGVQILDDRLVIVGRIELGAVAAASKPETSDLREGWGQGRKFQIVPPSPARCAGDLSPPGRGG